MSDVSTKKLPEEKRAVAKQPADDEEVTKTVKNDSTQEAGKKKGSTAAAPEDTKSSSSSSEKKEEMDRKRFAQLDDRDSKRLRTEEALTEAQHRALVEAIYEIGLKHASPSVIMEKMTETHDALTSERVKSHLQKYRNNHEKSKDEFLGEYDAWIQRALTLGSTSGSGGQLAPPAAILQMVGTGSSLLGGDLAAFLSYSIMQEEVSVEGAASQTSASAPFLTQNAVRQHSQEYTKHHAGVKIPFPVLTEEERKSPLGSAIGHVIGIFYSMSQHLMGERAKKEEETSLVAEPQQQQQPPPPPQFPYGVPQPAHLSNAMSYTATRPPEDYYAGGVPASHHQQQGYRMMPANASAALYQDMHAQDDHPPSASGSYPQL